jgi:hypothetical protein
MDERQDTLSELLRPRARVSAAELAAMPPSLTPAEAWPWTRQSRSSFYKCLARGEIFHCRLGSAIRIPTRRFLFQLGVLDEL